MANSDVFRYTGIPYTVPNWFNSSKINWKWKIKIYSLFASSILPMLDLNLDSTGSKYRTVSLCGKKWMGIRKMRNDQSLNHLRHEVEGGEQVEEEEEGEDEDSQLEGQVNTVLCNQSSSHASHSTGQCCGSQTEAFSDGVPDSDSLHLSSSHACASHLSCLSSLPSTCPIHLSTLTVPLPSFLPPFLTSHFLPPFF